MPDPNVLILGSDAFGRRVCAAINRWKMGDATNIDKSTVQAGETDNAFEQKTVGISIFRTVDNIDFVVLVASEATAENDKHIYARLCKWRDRLTGLIVISDATLAFADVDIFIPEHGNLTDEVLWFLDRTIARPTRVITPRQPSPYTMLVVSVMGLGVAMLLYIYTNPDPGHKTLEFEGLTISIEFPASLESGEEGKVTVCAKRRPGDPPAEVKVALRSRGIRYEHGIEKQNYVVISDLKDEKTRDFKCVLTSEASGIATTVEVYLDRKEIYLDSNKEEDKHFTVERRWVPFKKFATAEGAGLVSVLLPFASALWKRWLKKK